MQKNIVLIHGWGASTKKLELLGSELIKLGWKVFIPNLPGFELDPPKTTWGTSEYAAYVAQKANKYFKNKRYFVFGHSFGGGVSVYMASRNISQTAGVVLCSIRGVTRKNRVKLVLIAGVAKAGKLLLFIKPVAVLARKILYKVLREHDYESIENSVMKSTFKTIISEDIKPIAKKVTIPTLILWGQDDTMTPVLGAKILLRLIPKSSIKIYKNQRHALPYLIPNRIAKEINTWANTQN